MAVHLVSPGNAEASQPQFPRFRPDGQPPESSELEHPANVFPWYNLARLKGIQIKPVPAVDGRIALERVCEAIDERTRLVAVASVSFSPGFRFPLKALADYCRARGVLVLVDAAQSVGVLHTDVKALGVDAIAASAQKGLLALYADLGCEARRTADGQAVWRGELRARTCSDEGHLLGSDPGPVIGPGRRSLGFVKT